LPQGLYHKVLAVLDDKVMPYMTNPLQLSDFLINSYNIGLYYPVKSLILTDHIMLMTSLVHLRLHGV